MTNKEIQVGDHIRGTRTRSHATPKPDESEENYVIVYEYRETLGEGSRCSPYGPPSSFSFALIGLVDAGGALCGLWGGGVEVRRVVGRGGSHPLKTKKHVKTCISKATENRQAIHTYIHTCIHTYIHAYMHVCNHTRTSVAWLNNSYHCPPLSAFIPSLILWTRTTRCAMSGAHFLMKYVVEADFQRAVQELMVATAKPRKGLGEQNIQLRQHLQIIIDDLRTLAQRLVPVLEAMARRSPPLTVADLQALSAIWENFRGYRKGYRLIISFPMMWEHHGKTYYKSVLPSCTPERFPLG